VVSKQSQIGVMLIFLGLILIIIAILLIGYNFAITLIMGIIGLFLFYLGIHIVSYRFSRWFRKWYNDKKNTFREWLQK